MCRTLRLRSGHVSKAAIKRLVRKAGIFIDCCTRGQHCAPLHHKEWEPVMTLCSAGVRRMSTDFPSEAMEALRNFLRDILRDMIIITEHGRRHTATVMDVLLALKRKGRCGFLFVSSSSCFVDLQQHKIDIARLGINGMMCMQAFVWVWAGDASCVGCQAKEKLIPVHSAGSIASRPTDTKRCCQCLCCCMSRQAWKGRV